MHISQLSFYHQDNALKVMENIAFLIPGLLPVRIHQWERSTRFSQESTSLLLAAKSGQFVTPLSCYNERNAEKGHLACHPVEIDIDLFPLSMDVGCWGVSIFFFLFQISISCSFFCFKLP